MQSPKVVKQVNYLIVVAKTRPLIWRESHVVLAYLLASKPDYLLQWPASWSGTKNDHQRIREQKIRG